VLHKICLGKTESYWSAFCSYSSGVHQLMAHPCADRNKLTDIADSLSTPFSTSFQPSKCMVKNSHLLISRNSSVWHEAEFSMFSTAFNLTSRFAELSKTFWLPATNTSGSEAKWVHIQRNSCCLYSQPMTQPPRCTSKSSRKSWDASSRSSTTAPTPSLLGLNISKPRSSRFLTYLSKRIRNGARSRECTSSCVS
jgi:hypothetical protein